VSRKIVFWNAEGASWSCQACGSAGMGHGDEHFCGTPMVSPFAPEAPKRDIADTQPHPRVREAPCYCCAKSVMTSASPPLCDSCKPREGR